MSGRRLWIICGLAFMTSLGVCAIDVIRPYSYVRLCNLYRDLISRMGRTTAPNPNLAFLSIDAASVNLDQNDIDELFGLADTNSKEGRALRLMSKRFPWPREVYALVLERLVEAGARVVAFDLTFRGPAWDD